MHKSYILITRFSFFLVYTWFGILKILNLGQAYPLVSSLCEKLLPNINPELFFIFLGISEIYIGVLFLFPKLTNFAILITSLHLLTTFLPYIFSVSHTWMSYGVLSLEGQYILKNFFIISALIGLYIFEKESSSGI